jgi:hypothetical protein
MSKTTKPKAEGKEKQTTQPKSKPPASITQQNRNAKTLPGKPDVYKMLHDELVQSNAATYKYLSSLSEPGLAGRPPIDIGEWLLDTGIYEFPLDFTLTAGAAGGIYVALVADGWKNQTETQFAVTPGSIAWCSGVNGTNTPALGSAADANNVRLTISAPNDLALVANMDWRMVANIVEVWPESVLTNTSGSLLLATAASPTAIETAALNNTNFSTLSTSSQQFINAKEYPLGGWTSGKTARTHLVPNSQDCLKYNYLPATASATTAPTFGAVVIGSGMQPGQVVHVKVWAKYEISRGTGRSIDSTPSSLMPASKENVAKPLAALSQLPATMGTPQHHAIRPLLAMEAVRPGSATTLSGMLKDGFGSLLNTGIKAASSFLPGIIGKGFNAFKNLFG